MKHKDTTLRGKEVYLLRNESRKGIGFFEASGFYPDFILWVNDGEHQHVTFIDPKGIEHLAGKGGLENEKIQLFHKLKNEIEPMLGDADITLDSYIISNTDYAQVQLWNGRTSRQAFRDNHVLFDKDADHIAYLFRSILQG